MKVRKWIFWAIISIFWPASLGAAGGSLSYGPGSFDLNSCPALEVDSNGYLSLKARWDIETTPLTERTLAGVAFDEQRQAAVVFGGVGDTGQSLGDTWVWSSTSGWRNVSPSTAPSARYGHGLVWAGDKFVMFGGSSDRETWTYDVSLNSWSRLATINAPPANLSSPAMAYVSVSSKVVLTGGGQGSGTWIFDLAASSWSFSDPETAPQDRRGSVMVEDRDLGRVVLFGGQLTSSGEYLQDTWFFDPGNLSWSQMSGSSAPAVRAYASLSYDPILKSVLLFGGRNENSLGDFYFLETSSSAWRQISSSNNEIPSGRFGSGMVYDTANDRTLLFGGQRDNQTVSSMWVFLWRSSGSCESSSQSVSGATALLWNAVGASVGANPDGSQTLMQLAVSSSSASFDEFRGPEGSTVNFYEPLGTSTAVWLSTMNTRYLKVKTLLRAANPIVRPKVSALSVSYNRAPSVPQLLSPLNAARVNESTQTFVWEVAADPDGLGDIPLTYEIEASTSVDFSSASMSAVNLTLTQKSFLVSEGTWYWRVRARDNALLAGAFSEAWRVSVDTHTPPSAVTQLSVDKSTMNRSLLVSWIFPGDDKGFVNNGTYRIRYSTAGAILDEPSWVLAMEQSGLFSAASGQAMTTIISGLDDQTTYFVAIKTEDELGNLSQLSMQSPYAMTNSSPSVTLMAPVGGETLVGLTTVTWVSHDQNPNDFLSVSLSLIRESQENYHMTIATGLARSSTIYYWDSRLVANATDYRLLIVAVDSAGYSASLASAGLIRFDNVNEAPVVTIVTGPASGQRIEGDLTVAWRVNDPNAFDTHTFNVYLSVDGGASIAAVVAYDLSVTSITLDTLSFETRWGLGNLSTYQVKVAAIDSGASPMTALAATNVFEAVVKPDESLELLKPLGDDYPSLFDLKFQWQAPSGLAPPISYSVYAGTDSSLGQGSFQTTTNALSWTPAVSLLRSSTQYYWQIRSRDSLGRERRSQVKKFFFNRSRSRSTDGKLLVNISSGLPDGAYLAFQNASETVPQMLESARSWALADRYYQILGETAWVIKLKDESGQALSSDGVMSVVTLGFSDEDANEIPDGFLAQARHLRVARLNETSSRWEILPGSHDYDASSKTVSAQVSGFSVFTLVASAGSSDILSGVSSYPNPFDPAKGAAKIRYTLTQDSHVTITIYTLAGDLVRVLEFESGSSGAQGSSSGTSNEVLWDGRNGHGAVVANGVYIAEIKAESTQGQSKKIRRIGVVK